MLCDSNTLKIDKNPVRTLARLPVVLSEVLLEISQTLLANAGRHKPIDGLNRKVRNFTSATQPDLLVSVLVRRI
jgi:hypothetical protein